MRSRFLRLLQFNLFLLLLVFPLFVYSQSLEEKLSEIDAYAQKVREDWNQPGFAIGIVKDGKTVFTKGYGVRELGKPEKVDENTLFAIASNTKAFTTASLAILVDEKKLNWDDKVIKYLPEFQLADAYVTREMTIRDLITHRSGFDTFSGDLLWYETTYTNDEIIRRLRYLKPVSSFRSKYGYQNLMFITAGKVIERVSGKTWQAFVKERILDPLGMTRTTTSVKDLKDNYATPHNESGGKGMRPLHQGNVDGGAGAVRLNSSVADLTKWIRLQLGKGTIDGKKIFSEDRSWEMWQQYTPIQISPGAARNMPSRHLNGAGMGWFINDYQGRKMISHSGGLDGMLSYTVLLPEENVGFVVLTNGETSAFSIMMYKMLDVFTNAPKRDWNAEYLERAKRGKISDDEENAKVDAARAKNTKPTLSLPDYAGTYTSDLYGDVKIEEENGKLVMKMIPSPNLVADLEHWHYDTFQIKWRPSTAYNFPRGFVTFTIDKDGKTDQLKIDQPNNDFWFYELELKRTK
ncbi:MAG: serine hydrolase [Pyrinomonadaceae bacterium]|nr:serine hydrolase [Pyrinomonadaceae bacterium]